MFASRLSDTPSPTDQAHGLRRLFASAAAIHIPLVANPHVAFTSVVLERLTTALAALGATTLVVDAADSSPAPRELAALDLRAGIEPLSERVPIWPHAACRWHMWTPAARRHTARPPAGRGAELPRAAGARRRGRPGTAVHPRRLLRPLLLAADQPESLTHAYASLKLLAQRCGWLSCDLLLAAAPTAPRAALIARRLASCAENFLGAALREWLAIDPACDVRDPTGEALNALRGRAAGVVVRTAGSTGLAGAAPLRRVPCP